MLSEHRRNGEGICLWFENYYEIEVEKSKAEGLMVGILEEICLFTLLMSWVLGLYDHVLMLFFCVTPIVFVWGDN